MGALLFVVFAVMALAPQVFTSVDPRACSLGRSGEGPQPGAPFGYDVQGCDYYSNVVHGARISLAIGFLAVLGTLAIGVVAGIGAVRGGAGQDVRLSSGRGLILLPARPSDPRRR